VPARFFVDENDLALGKALAVEHGDVVFPGHRDLPEVPRGTLDDAWLPVVGARRLVVITRDQRIRYRPVEKRAWLEHRVRGFVLTGCKSQTTADSRVILARHWPTIEMTREHAADARPPKRRVGHLRGTGIVRHFTPPSGRDSRPSRCPSGRVLGPL
jgi:hypothetical protein